MKTEHLLASRIAELIHAGELTAGQHLPAQMLANRLNVSRSPVSAALDQLKDLGILRHQENRGYFVTCPVDGDEVLRATQAVRTQGDAMTSAYFRLAEDLLCGTLPPISTETELRRRYALSKGQLTSLLGRITSEGWAERRPGYGWQFSSMMTTPETLLQSYRLRLALEPAALLEPAYRLEKTVLKRCRAAEQHLLDGGIEHDTADQLHERGVRFHESIVEASGNPFFTDTIRRVNRIRRLLSYRSMRDRTRYRQHCEQHLHILELLEQERNEEASVYLRDHLQSTLDNMGKIQQILAPHPDKKVHP